MTTIEKDKFFDDLTEMMREDMNKIRGAKASLVAVDELENVDELIHVSPMHLAADSVRYRLSSMPSPTLMLNQPAAMTVKREGGKFSKRHHIGGENFKLSDCYVGKKGALIYVFTPLQACDYVSAEVAGDDALKMFGKSLESYLSEVPGLASSISEQRAEARTIKAAAAKEAERVKNEGKSETYAGIGWGDF